jgi:hypothetical protein
METRVNTGVNAGGIILLIVLICILVAAVIFLYRNYRRDQKKRISRENMTRFLIHFGDKFSDARQKEVVNYTGPSRDNAAIAEAICDHIRNRSTFSFQALIENLYEFPAIELDLLHSDKATRGFIELVFTQMGEAYTKHLQKTIMTTVTDWFFGEVYKILFEELERDHLLCFTDKNFE